MKGPQVPNDDFANACRLTEEGRLHVTAETPEDVPRKGYITQDTSLQVFKCQ